MSTPAASTKSVNSTSPDAQNATVDKQNGAPDAQPQQEQEQNGDTQDQAPTEPEGGYPEQKHAGAVGFGPEYGNTHRATFGEKVVGLKEEAVGKITRNQDKVQHGKQQRTGELKRKKLEEQDEANPFESVDDDNKKVNGHNDDDDNNKEAGDESNEDQQSAKKTKTDADAQQDENQMQEDTDYAEQPGSGNTATSTVTGKRGPGTHPTEKGAMEQAATTAPEGTEEAEQQRQGENTHADKQIDEAQNTSTSA